MSPLSIIAWVWFRACERRPPSTSSAARPLLARVELIRETNSLSVPESAVAATPSAVEMNATSNSESQRLFPGIPGVIGLEPTTT